MTTEQNTHNKSERKQTSTKAALLHVPVLVAHSFGVTHLLSTTVVSYFFSVCICVILFSLYHHHHEYDSNSNSSCYY